MDTLTNYTTKPMTVAQYIKQIPISKRTFSNIKKRYGADVLFGIFDILTSKMELGLKKRKFYDTFKGVVLEDTLDLFWELYIEKETGIENIWD